jgi:hypothetical protein
MQATIFKNDSFVRQASLQPIEALAGHYFLQFSSVLLTSKSPNAAKCNFDAVLDREGLESLQRLLNAALND